MTENKRFIDDGIEEIENQSFTDNLTEKTYWIDNGLDEIIDLLNEQHETIKKLQFRLNIITDQKNEFYRGARENANRVGKLKKENEQLKQDNNELENEIEKLENRLWNCQNVR